MEFDSQNYLALLHRLVQSKPGLGEKLKSIFNSYNHIEAYEDLLAQLETEVQSRVRFILSSLNEIDEPSLLDRELERILSAIDRILGEPEETAPSPKLNRWGEGAADGEAAEDDAAGGTRKKRKVKAKAKAKAKTKTKSKSKTKSKTKSKAKSKAKTGAKKKTSGAVKKKKASPAKKKSGAKKSKAAKKPAAKKAKKKSSSAGAKKGAKTKATAKPKKKAGTKKKGKAAKKA